MLTGLSVGNSPVTGEFPTGRASNAENVSIWWRHHEAYNTAVTWQNYTKLINTCYSLDIHKKMSMFICTIIGKCYVNIISISDCFCYTAVDVISRFIPILLREHGRLYTNMLPLSPAPLLPTKAYTTLVPKFEKHLLFADFGRKKTPLFQAKSLILTPNKTPLFKQNAIFS